MHTIHINKEAVFHPGERGGLYFEEVGTFFKATIAPMVGDDIAINGDSYQVTRRSWTLKIVPETGCVMSETLNLTVKKT